MYGTGGHVSDDPKTRFSAVFQAGVGDFAAIAEALLDGNATIQSPGSPRSA